MNLRIIKYAWQADSQCKKELKYIPETGEHVPFAQKDFFPPTGKAVIPQIKEMCNNRCPVKDECLEHALKHEKYGYWGGVSDKQRKVIRKKRGIKLSAPQSNVGIE